MTDPTTHLLEQVTALLGTVTLERDELRRQVHALKLDLEAFTGKNAMTRIDCETIEIQMGRGHALMEFRSGGENEWGNYEEPRPLRVFLNGNWHDIEEVRGALDEDVLRDAIDAETDDLDTDLDAELNAEYVSDCMSDMRRAA